MHLLDDSRPLTHAAVKPLGVTVGEATRKALEAIHQARSLAGTKQEDAGDVLRQWRTDQQQGKLSLSQMDESEGRLSHLVQEGGLSLDEPEHRLDVIGVEDG